MRWERFARRRAEGPDAGSPDRWQTDATIDVSREVVQTWDPGQGPLYGIEIHTKFAARMRELDLPGIGRHGIEQSLGAGDPVLDGSDGSIRTDVILRDGRTGAAPVRAI